MWKNFRENPSVACSRSPFPPVTYWPAKAKTNEIDYYEILPEILHELFRLSNYLYASVYRELGREPGLCDTFKDVIGKALRFCLFLGNNAVGRSDLLIRAEPILQPLHECTWDFVPETYIQRCLEVYRYVIDSFLLWTCLSCWKVLPKHTLFDALKLLINLFWLKEVLTAPNSQKY